MIMNRLFLSVAVLALTAGAALAADLPSSKAPILPPPPPPPMWTGFYAGLNAGATWANSNTIQLATYPIYGNPASAGLHPNLEVVSLMGSPNITSGTAVGFIGGGQIGYSYQINPSFVIGGETDFQGVAGSNSGGTTSAALDVSYSVAPTGFTTTDRNYAVGAAHKSLNYLGTVRGKVGFLIMPGLQIYGTVGFAYGGMSMNAFEAQHNTTPRLSEFIPGGVSYSGTLVGWAAGGGVEWMFAPNWSLKAEYLYYDLGSKQLNVGQLTRVWNGSAPPFAIGTPMHASITRASANFNGNIARVGVNYHFNWGSAAPVVAKY
jgi:outer membrane immunogenic protein